MPLTYLHLKPETAPPELVATPFRAVIVADIEVAQEWRNRIAEWLVAAGCLYVIAWGANCQAWHDSVDWAVVQAFDYGDIPDEKFVMTTWHANEPLSEAFWYAGNCAPHPNVDLIDTALLHISNEPREAEMLEEYAESQTTLGE